jgi:hypothetical protein
VSPNYLKSVWCGRELQVFLERREQLPVATPEESQSFVFPVFWEGHHRQYELPAVIRQFQYRLQDVPAEYEQRGVACFYRTQKKSVSRICESVADAIAEAFRRNLSGVPPKLGILRLSCGMHFTMCRHRSHIRSVCSSVLASENSASTTL